MSFAKPSARGSRPGTGAPLSSRRSRTNRPTTAAAVPSVTRGKLTARSSGPLGLGPSAAKLSVRDRALLTARGKELTRSAPATGRSLSSFSSYTSYGDGGESTSDTARTGASYVPPKGSRLLTFMKHEDRMTLDQMRLVIQQQIEQRTVADTDIFRKAFRMFGRPEGGYITPELFKRQMHKTFGIMVNDEENATLFASYDPEGLGRITLPDFLKRVLPRDYTAPLWNVKRDEEIDKEIEVREKPGAPHLTELPATLKARRWPLAKLEAKLQRKIEERTKRPSDQYRLAYALFGSPGEGISPEMFTHHLQTLGIVVTQEEIDALMDKYDDDGNGVIDFAELIRNIMPKDYTGKQWYISRDEEIDEYLESKHKPLSPTLASMPKSLEGTTMNLKQLREALVTKIVERTKRPTDQYREAFAIFGSAEHGIEPDAFREKLRALGLVVTDKQAAELFHEFDSNNTGVISFQELVANIMPPDYTEQPWNVKRDADIDREIEEREAGFAPRLKEWPKSLGKNRWTLHDIEEIIQQKIVERTKRPSDQYREAYALFNPPAQGISPTHMKEKLASFGMVLTDAEVMNMFRKYDLDGSGHITFSELVHGVMARDYTRKPWNVARDEELDREQQFLHHHRLAVARGDDPLKHTGQVRAHGDHERTHGSKGRHHHGRHGHHRTRATLDPIAESKRPESIGPATSGGDGGGGALSASKSEPALVSSRAMSARPPMELKSALVGVGKVGAPVLPSPIALGSARRSGRRGGGGSTHRSRGHAGGRHPKVPPVRIGSQGPSR